MMNVRCAFALCQLLMPLQRAITGLVSALGELSPSGIDMLIRESLQGVCEPRERKGPGATTQRIKEGFLEVGDI